MGLGSVFIYLSFLTLSIICLWVSASQVSPSQPPGSQALATQRPYPWLADYLCFCRCWFPLLCVTVFSHKLGFLSSFFFFFFFLEWFRNPLLFFFFPFISWMFPTPRLGRYLIKTSSDFFFFVCVIWA